MSFNSLWSDVVTFIPALLIAILVVIVGWIVANFAKGLIERAIRFFNIDDLLDKAGVDTLTEKAGHKFRPAHFIGTLVKWFIILIFLVAALDILRLDEVTVFFRDIVLGYLPKVIVAVLILLVSMIVANIASTSVVAGARAVGFKAADMLGSIARYAIIVFAVLAALAQLEIAPELVETLFMGIVFASALAFGLAFGLGGKETAAKYLKKMTGDSDHSNHSH